MQWHFEGRRLGSLDGKNAVDAAGGDAGCGEESAEAVGGCGAMDPVCVPVLRPGNVGNHK